MLNLIQTNAGHTIVMEQNTREFLLETLVKKMEELGRAPTREEIASDLDMPTLNNYVYIFANFENAIEEASLYKLRKEGVKPTAKIREKYSTYFKKTQ